MNKQGITVACFFATCQGQHTGQLPEDKIGQELEHTFAGGDNLFAFSYNCEPGKLVLDYSNMYTKILIGLLLEGGEDVQGACTSLQEVLEDLPDKVFQVSAHMERPWNESNLGRGSRAVLWKELCSLSPTPSSTAEAQEAVLALEVPVPAVCRDWEGTMTLWKDRFVHEDGGVGAMLTLSVGFVEALSNFKLRHSDATDWEFLLVLPSHMALIKEYLCRLGLRFPERASAWADALQQILLSADDEQAKAIYMILARYATNVYNLQLKRMVDHEVGLDHEVLLRVERCLSVAANGLVQQCMHTNKITQNVLATLHCWAVAHRWLGNHSKCNEILVDMFRPLLQRAAEDVQTFWLARRAEAQNYRFLRSLRSNNVSLPVSDGDVGPFLYDATRWYFGSLLGQVSNTDFAFHMELNELLTWQPHEGKLCTPCIPLCHCAYRSMLVRTVSSHYRVVPRELGTLCFPWARAWMLVCQGNSGSLVWQTSRHRRIGKQVPEGVESASDLVVYAAKAGQVVLLQRML